MIESDNVQICMGDTARIDVSGDAEVYEWQTAEGIPLQYGVEQWITLSPDTTTVLTVIGYRSICAPDTITTTVDVYGNFDYDLPEKGIVYKGEEYRIPMQIEDSDIDISWNPAAYVDCEKCPAPLVLTDSSMTFYVSLSEPVLGCTTTDSIALRFPARCTGDFAHLPNVFSPNGDGVNDYVTLETSKYKSPIEFSVFDRWGNRVYNADSIDFEWNGTNGTEFLSPGVYVYRLQLTCPIDDSPVVVTGDITIVR
jgi:gliding motility-associated-like protein